MKEKQLLGPWGSGAGNGSLGKRLGTTVLIEENYGESSFYIQLLFLFWIS